jgi:hypothetical protein
MDDAIKVLSSLPVDDGNFKYALSKATDYQIRLAIEEMKNRNGKDKSRIAACERELKRRAVRNEQKQSK